MSAVLTTPPTAPRQESPGLWTLAWRRLKQDTIGMVSLVVVAFFLVMMLASAMGYITSDWSKERGVSYANPSFMAGAENLEARSMAANFRRRRERAQVFARQPELLAVVERHLEHARDLVQLDFGRARSGSVHLGVVLGVRPHNNGNTGVRPRNTTQQ